MWRPLKQVIVNYPIIYILPLFFAVHWSFFGLYRIPSSSMEPTIQIGDRVLVNKFAYDLRPPFSYHSVLRRSGPQRGDVVVFLYPEDKTINFIKRIVGLPGDTVTVEGGFLQVNHNSLALKENIEQEYEDSTLRPFKYIESFDDLQVLIQKSGPFGWDSSQTFEVPKDHYFVVGDNRDHSSDSRSWGFLPREMILGKALSVVLNLNMNGWVPTLDWNRLFKDLYSLSNGDSLTRDPESVEK